MKFQIAKGVEGFPGVAHYINLTNGVEALLNHYFSEVNFIRLQSTKLEQGLYDDITMELDYDFLMHLALGYEIIIYDFSKKKTSRAMWQGVEWIKYLLNRVWFNKKITCPKGMHINFSEQYQKLSKKTKKKIKYFRKFLKTDHLEIKTVCSRTVKDGDYCFYSSVLDKWLEGSISYD